MLNFGFLEILIVVVLALVVVGPERLPIVVRYLGRQYGKLLRASQELRRAFVLEAERVDAEERQKELQKIRERRKREEDSNKKQVEESIQDDRVEPLAAGIGTHQLESHNSSEEVENMQSADTVQPNIQSKANEFQSDENHSNVADKNKKNLEKKSEKESENIDEDMNDDPLFPRSKRDFS